MSLSYLHYLFMIFNALPYRAFLRKNAYSLLANFELDRLIGYG